MQKHCGRIALKHVTNIVIGTCGLFCVARPLTLGSFIRHKCINHTSRRFDLKVSLYDSVMNMTSWTPLSNHLLPVIRKYTALGIPSLVSRTPVILPMGHSPRANSFSLMATMSPTLNTLTSLVHFCLTCKFAKYSRCPRDTAPFSIASDYISPYPQISRAGRLPD